MGGGFFLLARDYEGKPPRQSPPQIFSSFFLLNLKKKNKLSTSTRPPPQVPLEASIGGVAAKISIYFFVGDGPPDTTALMGTSDIGNYFQGS